MIGKITKKKPSKHLMDYLLGQNIPIDENIFSGKASNEKADFDLDAYVAENKIEAAPGEAKETKKKEEKDPKVSKMDNLLNPNYQSTTEEKPKE